MKKLIFILSGFFFFIFTAFYGEGFKAVSVTDVKIYANTDIPSVKSYVEFPSSWNICRETHQEPFEKILDKLPSSLYDQRIEVRYTSINSTMNVRPTVWSLIFRSRDNRKYVIRINDDAYFKGVRYNDVSVRAKAGLWAHEMMHVKDYKNRGFFGVLQRGWQYLSKSGKQSFEEEIDQMVIDYGLGYYLLHWAWFVLEESNASDSYKEYKRNIYMTPDEIIEYKELSTDV
ncbi:hypothetical protein QA597_08460 [Marinilabiliaceae bacterium ANBcel2]|nr:hypothetical protein [Marinilabiliaceae bacterium ANBcel2]